MKRRQCLPENHPLRSLFRTLTQRGLVQEQLRDQDISTYLTELLIDFTFVENMYGMRDAEGKPLEYLVDMLQRAMEIEMPAKKSYFKHIGDYSLFVLGMFPESLSRPRQAVSAAYYADAGRIGYRAAGELESNSWNVVVFRKLAGEFERCVLSLNRVREYASDPFYQFMFREFNIT